jgi:exoribonuclease-2
MDRPINLQAIARDTLQRYGFLIDSPAPAQAELARLSGPDFNALKVRDLSGWLWSSIDNDDSRDLDQIEYLQPQAGGSRLYVAIADVSALVAQN